jgi:hypothetical protein
MRDAQSVKRKAEIRNSLRPNLLIRLILFLAVLAFMALVVMFGRWLGLTEILIVGLIIVALLLAEGVRVVVAQVIRGYRGEQDGKPSDR